MSRAREATTGRQVAEAIEQSMGIVDDAALRAYVIGVGQRIAAFSPRRDVTYRFDVVDSEVPNAFALPGGYVYVSRGLLSILNSEAELAGVLGHEIVHVAARHSAQAQTRATGIDMLAKMGALAGVALGGVYTGAAIGDLGRVAGAGLIASYSRDQERESDREGQRIAALAGYDPAGLPSALRALGADAEARTGSEGEPGFLDSHPGTLERVDTTTRMAPRLAVGTSRGTRATRAEFLAEIDGLRIGQGASRGVFLGSFFVHPDLDFALRFPRGWQPFNVPARAFAIAPQRDGLVEVVLQGGERDPAAAARSFLAERSASATSRESLEIGGFPAHRVQGRIVDGNGSFYAQWVFIAHPSGMFRLTATAPVSKQSEYRDAMQQALESFRRPSPGELSRVRELRLRVVNARAGEMLEALSRRAGNRWTVEQTARANAIDAGQPLDEGFPVKVVVQQTYAR